MPQIPEEQVPSKEEPKKELVDGSEDIRKRAKKHTILGNRIATSCS